jgi:hypothetical protein
MNSRDQTFRINWGDSESGLAIMEHTENLRTPCRWIIDFGRKYHFTRGFVIV